MADLNNQLPRMGNQHPNAHKIMKDQMKKEDEIRAEWEKNNSWMVDIYRDMQKKLSEMSKESEFLKQVFTDKEDDNRSIKPIPESVNHEYGWLASKKEFQNKIPEKITKPELPPNYKLLIPYDSPYWCYLKS
ncbi:hypothetical protein WA026_018645 [Henosepilachna vigintioctopunctata]|uniref:Uncharacterized protein n=1 Tax=Henosepilachna vigintioctopunctata TaxID=420089 RepID=A0AAW1U4P2_9CUCU